ncbi:FAD binding domain-containing protein [Nakamurella leprariae]|uniref:FAD binding domain-containing protein n=1 Tax=Nakamurella leprariae TaxID=2803911 RepID=A0A938YB03_9ACTN|nr:FAD binding domain-containing protein [Nakamurella leprariae]MBM9466474.1 FAD binding domain-containing protein [Nakamurella leprariae]
MTGTPTYAAPTGIAEATALLTQAQDPAVLSGGTMLVPEMSHRTRRPDLVLDLRNARLSGVRVEADTLTIGAATTYRQVLDTTLPGGGAALAVLQTVARGITGGPQIRNRGTVGGSAAWANPSSDVPGLLVGLDATIRVDGAGGHRLIAAQDWVTGAFRTARAPAEILTGITAPTRPRHRFGYVKFKLAESSWPIVTATCLASPVGNVVLSVGGAFERPLRLSLAGVPADLPERELRTLLAEQIAAADPTPWTDVLADGAYRARISPVIAARAVQQALAKDPNSGEEPWTSN